jgi:D-alanyl-D-alanine carboxypeptidase
MKRILSFLLIAVLVCSASGCSNRGGADSAAGDVSDVEIDYGKSDLYTHEEMDAAIRVIEHKFRTWKGFKLYRVYYVSDENCSEENLDWLNELEQANDNKEHFTQCILFESDFHTAKNDDGFEEDADYTHWNWWLGRSEGGDWKLMTWGYA